MPDRELIESYGRGYKDLADALEEIPEEMWEFKPAPDRWSVHEIIIHMADSEVNSYSRSRKIIAESGSSITAYDQDKLAVETRYSEQSTSDALELFKWLRKMSYNVIKDLPREYWDNFIMHPENGKMTLEDWLRVYESHVRVHINQMKRNLAEWKKSGSR